MNELLAPRDIPDADACQAHDPERITSPRAEISKPFAEARAGASL